MPNQAQQLKVQVRHVLYWDSFSMTLPSRNHVVKATGVSDASRDNIGEELSGRYQGTEWFGDAKRIWLEA